MCVHHDQAKVIFWLDRSNISWEISGLHHIGYRMFSYNIFLILLALSTQLKSRRCTLQTAIDQVLSERRIVTISLQDTCFSEASSTWYIGIVSTRNRRGKWVWGVWHFYQGCNIRFILVLTFSDRIFLYKNSICTLKDMLWFFCWHIHIFSSNFCNEESLWT